MYEEKRASLVAQTVKNPPAMQEIWVWFLGLEDPLEKGMATHSSSFAWRITWTEKPGWSHKVLDMAKRLSTYPHEDKKAENLSVWKK